MKEVEKDSRLRSINILLDRLNFYHIFVIWTGILVIFGVLYHLLAGPNNYLVYTVSNQQVSSLFDSIYFSFITATSTGFGDIAPIGIFKLMSILEVIFGLVLLAIVTSKLVSIKQDVIMNEIYDISFNEKINRIRSSLLLFRQNLNRVISNIESNNIRHREISDIFNYISSLEDNLTEISNLMDRKKGHSYTKELDPLSTELLFHSINQSFERLYELITVMNSSKLEWRRKVTLDLINRCLVLDTELFNSLHGLKAISEKEYADLHFHNKRVIEPFKSCLNSSDNACEFDIAKIREGKEG
jgi:potassium channel LctB